MTAYTSTVPFKSKAQRGYLWANHPEVAREFASATPKGVKLPDHVKKANETGMARALERFGLRQAGEELRLKIPDRTFHGLGAAARAEAQRGHAKQGSMFGDRRSSEDLAEMLQALDNLNQDSDVHPSKDPLDRSTSWGPPSSTAAGDVGSRMGIGPSGFGGI